MQRYLSSGFGYTYFGTAFQDATVNEFAEEVNLNASFPAFFTVTMKTRFRLAGFTYTAAGNTLVAGQGYAANLWNIECTSNGKCNRHGKQRNRCFKPLQS